MNEPEHAAIKVAYDAYLIAYKNWWDNREPLIKQSAEFVKCDQTDLDSMINHNESIVKMNANYLDFLVAKSEFFNLLKSFGFNKVKPFKWNSYKISRTIDGKKEGYTITNE